MGTTVCCMDTASIANGSKTKFERSKVRDLIPSKELLGLMLCPRLLAPILKQSLNPLEKQKPSEAKSVLQAVRNTFDASEQGSLDAHVQLQMNIGSAALFTTTTSCFHVLYQLATHPEYVDPIRKEIADTVIGSMDKTCSEKLFMLDSFIRETQRWCNLTQRKLHPLSCVFQELTQRQLVRCVKS